jgi:hypothetical protein
VLTVDFSLSPKVVGIQKELEDFMQTWIYPSESAYDEQVRDA